MYQIGHFIDGESVNTGESSSQIYNPSIGEVAGQVLLAGEKELELALEAASKAFPAWRNTEPVKRARIMSKFKELVELHSATIIELIGKEHGKISHDAKGEIARGIENIEYACYVPELLKGEYSKNAGPSIDTWTELQPLGVVAGITPFNFPAMVPLWMYPMAIACGNTFILKPSEKNPSAALFIAQLLSEAGLPKGVLNVINGDQYAVESLLKDDRVKAVSFVGSTPIAKSIYQQANANGKRCQALGGAKNHAIVMPDADIENASNALLGAAFGSSGERCMAISVAVTVGDECAEQLVSSLLKKIPQLKVGSFEHDSNDFGPVISAAHLQKVEQLIQSAADDGASLLIDGRNTPVNGPSSGYYVGGTLIDHVSADMLSYQEEIFGPVLLVLRCQSLEQAMQVIAAHPYGNGTCIFTRDGEAARYFSDHVEVGMVGINVPLPVPVASHSFGGWKQSLFGDLNAYGPDAVRFYTRKKTITQRWPSSSLRESAQFAFPS
ncbi:CoA-acylating methylmalonate-semialdehyde dehydrogenase [Alginatibacterium sediminis]|uniref:methylmalonate-semialdehyde dehydrogenase (CoA acylating) n=1 Tax=Alginatibacterium sediminis TaxID=2164068 RepID=A0A420EBA7_9ALTE|nr:CoA-acylating methylmalonate-semialdehyde dehydrogenase [Alginatibacterium sediminis]RKF17977.1 CoA-acylating methylmalonate-semialdehyde dehydrogenase [Alginatibacterium sediminis]